MDEFYTKDVNLFLFEDFLIHAQKNTLLMNLLLVLKLQNKVHCLQSDIAPIFTKICKFQFLIFLHKFQFAFYIQFYCKLVMHFLQYFFNYNFYYIIILYYILLYRLHLMIIICLICIRMIRKLLFSLFIY